MFFLESLRDLKENNNELKDYSDYNKMNNLFNQNYINEKRQSKKNH